jgi:pimeloyl-ACP methyl ester carboxylesterase
MPRVLLIHGGLWEDIGASWFWGRTGVIDGLARRGFTVIAPDRLRRAPSWAAEASHIASMPDLAGEPMTVVGGSFGSAVAVRLALDFPGLVGRLMLGWPTSTADQFARIRFRAGLARQGAPSAVLDALLGTETLPSATDAELRTLAVPAAVVPSAPPTNALHPRSAVDRLLRLLPSVVELPGYPEPPRPEFAPHLESFVAALADFARE